MGRYVNDGGVVSGVDQRYGGYQENFGLSQLDLSRVYGVSRLAGGSLFAVWESCSDCDVRHRATSDASLTPTRTPHRSNSTTPSGQT
jgi:hypothetical protein